MLRSHSRRRIVGASILTAGALGVATFAPVGATAAEDSPNSYAEAQFIGVPDSLLSGLSTEQLAKIDGVVLEHDPTYEHQGPNSDLPADAVSWKYSQGNVVTLSDDIEADVLGIIPLDGIGLDLNLGDIVTLGAVSEWTKATRFGASVAYAGTASAMDGAITAFGNGEGYDLQAPDADQSPAASIDLDLEAVSVTAEIGAVYAAAGDNRNASKSRNGEAQGWLSHKTDYGIAGVKVEVGGSVLEPTLNSLTTLLGFLGLDLESAGLIENGRVVVDLERLLAASGTPTINELPPGSNLLEYLPEAVIDALDETVRDLIPDSALDILVDPILDLLNGLTSTLLTPLTEALAPALALNVNNVTDEGSVAHGGKLSVTALEVSILEDSLVLPLATATVGPNTRTTFNQGSISTAGELAAGNGQTLTVTPGDDWLPHTIHRYESTNFDYRWVVDGELVQKDWNLKTPASFELDPSYAGKKLRLVVRPDMQQLVATKWQTFKFGTIGSSTTSAFTKGDLDLTGSAKAGSTLKAVPASGWLPSSIDISDAVFDYRWVIGGELQKVVWNTKDGSQLRFTSAQKGDSVRLVVRPDLGGAFDARWFAFDLGTVK